MIKTKDIKVLVILFSFIIAVLAEKSYDDMYQYLKNENSEVFIARIISNKEEKDYTNKYIIKYNHLRFILYTSENLDYGDLVKIEGIIKNAEENSNYNGYNYLRNLRQKKIYGICIAEKTQKIQSRTSILKYIFKIKKDCEDILSETFPENVNDFLKGILLGENSLSNEFKNNFKDSSLSHVLAISGMHVNYVIMFVTFVLDKIILPKRVNYYISIMFLIFFWIFTGMSVSCGRACIMSILVFVSKLVYRKSDFCSNLFFALSLFLLINPYNIESVGLWLSFLGSFALGNLKIESKSWIINTLVTCFITQIFVFPIILYNYNTISLTFFISNFFVSIFIGPALILGYLSIFFNKLYILIFLEELLVKIILIISKFVASLKLSKIYVFTPNIIVMIFYYIFLYFIIKKRDIVKKYKKFILKILFLFLIIYILKNMILYDNKFTIHMIDVGQGDCTVITSNFTNIIVDGGDKTENFNYGERVVLPYLLNRKVKVIDYLIVSHFDSDHAGGLIYLAENLKVKNVIIGIQYQENENLKELVKIINKNKINLIVLSQGDKINLDDDIYLEVLFPMKNKYVKENIINNNSLVFKLIYKDTKILFTGDIEEETENMLVNEYKEYLKCDILKVAHHGSDTSSTNNFIHFSNPKIALIGVGKDNKFGHPNKNVINRLKQINANIYRTDINGEITIKVEKNRKMVVKVHNK